MRLRDNKGRFISNYKANIIQKVAEKKNIDAQSFLKENWKKYEKFIQDNFIKYRFSDDNYEEYIHHKRININGENLSYGRAIIFIQEFISAAKTEGTAVRIIFNVILKNQKNDDKKIKGKFNNVFIKIPETYDSDLHGTFENYMENIIWKQTDVEIHISEKK